MRLAKQSQFIPLQNVVYFITLPFLVYKIFAFYINDVLLFKCPFPGPKVNKEVYDTVDKTMGTHTVCRHGAIMAVANMFV